MLTNIQIKQLIDTTNTTQSLSQINDELVLIDTPHNTVRKITYQELQNKLKPQKKIDGNCEFCNTGYFEDDRNCVSCGGEIKRYEEVKNEKFNNKKNKPTKYMLSMSNFFSYDENDELIFTAISLMDTSIELKTFNNQLQKMFIYQQPSNIQINDIEWKIRERNCPAVVKLILESQIVSVDDESIIETFQYVIPKAKLMKKTSINFDAQPLLTRYYYQKDKSSDEFYGYIINIQRDNV